MAIPQRGTETSLSELLKATVAGGMLFLLPLVLVVLLLGHAMKLAGKVAHPVSEILTLDKVIGPAGQEALAVVQYRMVKTMAEGFAQIESAEDLKPVLVIIEEGWQIGYLLEQLHDGWVAVFLPQAPTPMSGNVNVMYLPGAPPILRCPRALRDQMIA